MTISYVKFNQAESRLIVKLSQTLEGDDWFRIVSVVGDDALKIWNQWGTDNEKEIIALLLAL